MIPGSIIKNLAFQSIGNIVELRGLVYLDDWADGFYHGLNCEKIEMRPEFRKFVAKLMGDKYGYPCGNHVQAFFKGYFYVLQLPPAISTSSYNEILKQYETNQNLLD
jgi:hypothetical protein